MVSKSLYRALATKSNFVAYIDKDGERVSYYTSGSESRKKPCNLKKQIAEKIGLPENRIYVGKFSASGSDYAWKTVKAFLDNQEVLLKGVTA